MAIFIKSIRRESNAIVAIEADTQEQADKIFDDWCEDNVKNDNDELGEVMEKNEKVQEEWINSFESMEDYISSPLFSDILVVDKKDDEPRYDLYITYTDHNTKRTAYLGCTMDTVLFKLDCLNDDYKLRSKYYLPIECLKEAKKHNTTVLWFEAESRGED